MNTYKNWDNNISFTIFETHYISSRLIFLIVRFFSELACRNIFLIFSTTVRVARNVSWGADTNALRHLYNKKTSHIHSIFLEFFSSKSSFQLQKTSFDIFLCVRKKNEFFIFVPWASQLFLLSIFHENVGRCSLILHGKMKLQSVAIENVKRRRRCRRPYVKLTNVNTPTSRLTIENFIKNFLNCYSGNRIKKSDD